MGDPLASRRHLAIVTGASAGIGLHLALEAASHGYDLILTDHEPLDRAAELSQSLFARVETRMVDLSTAAGVAELYALADGRPVAALLVNVGRGAGHAFVDQGFAEVQRVIDTHITGTVDLVQRVVSEMRANGTGKILLTTSVRCMPGLFEAVYDGCDAFLNSFAYALGKELKGTGVTVTCVMPGTIATESPDPAGPLAFGGRSGDRSVDAAEVAKVGFHAMQSGDAGVTANLSDILALKRGARRSNTK